MTAALGNYALTGAVLAAAAAIVASLGAGRFDSAGWLRAARWLLAAMAAMLTLAAASLMVAILGDQFDLAYVAHYSERALPIGYKLTVFWAGQAGSLLLWAWMIAVLGLVAAVALRKQGAWQQAGTGIALALVVGFFAALMLFVYDANPFSLSVAEDPNTHEVFAYAPADGQGLNPMLQNPAMMAHPPTLFLGYAGFTVAFALTVGGLLAGRLGGDWLARVRRWALASWVLLGIGILLRSWWAYVELGWGGYWAWNPVENASLLPWLTGTALLHVLAVQRSRGLFKGAGVALAAATFLLCIFGTYLTRSGIIQSVHSFGKSDLGTVLPAFLLLLAAGSVALTIWRRGALRPEQADRTWARREWVFAVVAGLLVLMTLFTMVGTLSPIITEVFSGNRMAVEQQFYNDYVLVLWGLPLLALMAFAPVAVYGRQSRGTLGWFLALAGILGSIGIAVAAALGARNMITLAAVGIATATVAVMLVDLKQSLAARRAAGLGWRDAAARLMTANRGRYGAYLAHLGAVMILLGVTGSSLHGTEQIVRVAEGKTAEVGEYVLTFRGLRDVRKANYGATEAVVDVTMPGGRQVTLRPQQRRYNKSPDVVNHEIALECGLREDLYLALAGGDPNGENVFIKVLIKPLLVWIWIGGMVLTVGGLLPRMLPALWAAPAVAPADERSLAGPVPRLRRRPAVAKPAALKSGRQ